GPQPSWIRSSSISCRLIQTSPTIFRLSLPPHFRHRSRRQDQSMRGMWRELWAGTGNRPTAMPTEEEIQRRRLILRHFQSVERPYLAISPSFRLAISVSLYLVTDSNTPYASITRSTTTKTRSLARTTTRIWPKCFLDRRLFTL